jgi:hypothetical protein
VHPAFAWHAANRLLDDLAASFHTVAWQCHRQRLQGQRAAANLCFDGVAVLFGVDAL